MGVEFVRAVVPENGHQVSVSRAYAELAGLEILPDKPAIRAGRPAADKPKKSVDQLAAEKSDPIAGGDESPEPQGVVE